MRPYNPFWAAVMLIVAGCQVEWHLAITGFDSSSRPQFCITLNPGCSGKGVDLGYFLVQELVVQGAEKSHRTVWFISAKTNQPLRNFTYGVTPPGWEQVKAPERLQ